MTWKTDKMYGRGGGRYIPASGVDLNGPACEVCGRPMVVGQKKRHLTCSPPAECCGHPVDLLGPKHNHDQEN